MPVLDKSIPFKKVLMKREAPGPSSAEPRLPEGFSFHFYKEGDEHHWARIETSVLEFDSEKKALEYFKREFAPHVSEIKKRCVFINSPEGLPIATTTAWFCSSDGTVHPQLHWVAVCPEYQRKGLGKAIVRKALQIFSITEPGKEVWLGTQTWSHAAIRLYYQLGFRVAREETVDLSSNKDPSAPRTPYEIDAALEILKTVLDESFYQKLIATVR